MADRRWAKVRYSGEWVAKLLMLPRGSTIRAVDLADYGRDLDLVIESPDLPPVPEAGPIPFRVLPGGCFERLRRAR